MQDKETEETEEEKAKREFPEKLRQAQYQAANETIRQSKKVPYNVTVQAALASSAYVDLDTPRLQPNRLYTITHVSATNETHVRTRTELYYVLGEEEYAINRDVQSAAGISIDFNGRILLGEGTRIRAKFVGGQASDVCKLTVSGYWINE